MPHYQSLLFGCVMPRTNSANHNPINETAIISAWIEQMSKVGRIQLDWPASVRTLAPLVSDQDAILGDCLPGHADSRMLADLCLPLSADIQTALLRWEITRFAARGIDLDLPAGRLFLLEGWYDEMPAH
jgi:hypothetical protein